MEFINNVKQTVKEAVEEAKNELVETLTNPEEEGEEQESGINPMYVALGVGATGAALYFGVKHFKGKKEQKPNEPELNWFEKKLFEKVQNMLDKHNLMIVKKSEEEEEQTEDNSEEDN